MSGIEALLAQQIIGLNEAIDDRTASLLVAGTGISLSYNDGAGTLTIANTGLGGSTGSTDNRILRSDGTGGATVQASAVTIDDSGNISGVGTITASDVVSIPVNGTAASPALRVGTQVSGLTAGTNQLHFVVDGAVRAWADRNSLLQANGFQVNIPGGYFTINADVFSCRNATGPSWEIRAAGGLRVCNAAGSAFANISLALLFVGTYTVGTLPSVSANAGASAQVTDSSVTTNGLAVAGGGTSRVLVFSNGTTWDVIVA